MGQVAEFIDFGKKLKNSATAASAAASNVLWYHAFTGLVQPHFYRIGAGRLLMVEPEALVCNEDRHCVQQWNRLPEGEAPYRWDSSVAQDTRDAIYTQVLTARGVEAALMVGNPPPDALSVMVERLRAVPGSDAPRRQVSIRLLEICRGMEGLLTFLSNPHPKPNPTLSLIQFI